MDINNTEITNEQLEAIREAHNAYNRSWRAKNKDKVKKYNRTYWLKKATKQRTDES